MPKIIIETTINNQRTEFMCESSETLLEVLRDRLLLTGSKEGCNNGNCGACNIILDGVLVNSCLVLAAEVQNKNIETVEGLSNMDGLIPLQLAFLEEAALQCGICTPGFLIASNQLLKIKPNPKEHEIREWLAGNLCRCTGYDKIINAVLKAANNNEVSNGK